LHKNNQPEIFGDHVGLETYTNVLAEDVSFLKPSNLDQFLHNGHVCEESPAIFTVRNVRFRVIESDGCEDIGIPLFLPSVHIDVRSENWGRAPFNAQPAYTHRNLRGRGRFHEYLTDLIRLAQPQFSLSIHNRLWGIGRAESHSSNIGTLPVSQ
jgi:hypothetical protein